MPGIDDDQPKRQPAHEIGQDLATLSLDELAARITALQDEIRRLEAAIRTKQAGAAAADAVFRR